jgi:uncharacterized membrane protein
MMTISSRKLALLALLTALVAAATRAIQIPTPATRGYVNLGDGMIFVAALLFGGGIGGLAGGVGSALADLLGGYASWALPTLIIKGLEGLLVGVLFGLTRRNMGQKLAVLWAVPILLVGGLWMVGGYYATEVYLYGWAAAALGIPGNLFQAITGVVVCIPVAAALARAGVTRPFLDRRAPGSESAGQQTS